MKITDVRVKALENQETRLRGVASIVFDGEFVVHDLKIIEGADGLFVVMPSKKMPDGKYRDIAHPLFTEVRERIRDAVLEAYLVALENPDALSDVEF